MRADKNLWGTEEDEELRNLYDQHRVENGNYLILIKKQF